MVSLMRSRALFAALPLAIGLLARPASADQTADAARAQALFTSGRAALERGDYTVACAELSESLSLVVRSNTLFNLAQCEEHEGKLVDARRHWRQGMELLAPEDQRLGVARGRIEGLDRRIPRIQVQLAGDAPAETRVELDGRPVSPAALAEPIAADPGAHAITVHAPGHAARKMELTLREGETRSVLLSLSTGVAPPPVVIPPSRGRPVVGWVLGGIGVAGLAVAGVTGGMLVARHGAIQDACPDKLCSPEGRRLIDGTRPLDIANAAGFIAGAAGIGAGALVLILGNRGSTRATAVPVAGGGVAVVTGSF